MIKIYLTGIIIAFFLISCNKQEENPILNNRISDAGIFFRTSSGLTYSFDDFDFYDSSAYMFYFKTNHEELEYTKLHYFTFVENDNPIYSGKFWPPIMSSIPSGPFIGSMFSSFPDYTMKIGYIYGDEPDPRNSPEMIRVLKEHGLLRSGLSVTIDDAEINSTIVTIDVTVTNNDVTDLLVLDPDKMGIDLFNYFTSGAYVYTVNYDFLAFSVVNYAIPDIEQEWSEDWLTKLGHDESLNFRISYTLNEKISADDYIVKFRYPGLGNQVKLEQLYQDNARIWLGDILCSKRVSAE